MKRQFAGRMLLHEIEHRLALAQNLRAVALRGLRVIAAQGKLLVLVIGKRVLSAIDDSLRVATGSIRRLGQSGEERFRGRQCDGDLSTLRRIRSADMKPNRRATASTSAASLRGRTLR